MKQNKADYCQSPLAPANVVSSSKLLRSETQSREWCCRSGLRSFYGCFHNLPVCQIICRIHYNSWESRWPQPVFSVVEPITFYSHRSSKQGILLCILFDILWNILIKHTHTNTHTRHETPKILPTTEMALFSNIQRLELQQQMLIGRRLQRSVKQECRCFIHTLCSLSTYHYGYGIVSFSVCWKHVNWKKVSFISINQSH